MNVSKTKKSNLNYEVTAEKKVLNPEVSFVNIYLKKLRIIGAFIKMNKNLSLTQTVDENNNVINDHLNDQERILNQYFSYEPNITTSENRTVTPLPEFCRKLPGTNTKPACINCQAAVAFSMKSLNQISPDDINEELVLHGHPSSRKIPNATGKLVGRIKEQAVQELREHYIYVHNATD
jgi:hypothetical protein